MIPEKRRLNEYGPPSAITEADLMGRPRRRVEACLCGGTIVVEDTADHWLVERGVRVHQATSAHRRWRSEGRKES